MPVHFQHHKLPYSGDYQPLYLKGLPRCSQQLSPCKQTWPSITKAGEMGISAPESRAVGPDMVQALGAGGSNVLKPAWLSRSTSSLEDDATTVYVFDR